jgi:predicted transcriptional regulator
MPERIMVRLDDELYGRLSDAAKARGLDGSAMVRRR